MKRTVSLQELEDFRDLCDELRAILFKAIVDDWSAVSVLAALVEEKLLCCMGDPESRSAPTCVL
jgi:hypothetical protein